jgi:cell wall-associated NlpC family hydrolase
VENSVVEAARKYLGVKFAHTGRSDKGLDCIGLVALVAKDLGYEFRDNRNYSKRPHPDVMIRGIEQFAKKVKGGWKPGDILVFSHASVPCHCAIATGDDTMIHCPATRPRKVNETTIGHYAEKVIGVSRWRR